MNESINRATPGPWKYITNSESRRGVTHIESTRGHAVATVAVRPNVEEEFANSHLIASAPDLMAACEAAFHALKSYEYGNSATDLAKETAEAVRVAIQKAKGGAL